MERVLLKNGLQHRVNTPIVPLEAPVDIDLSLYEDKKAVSCCNPFNCLTTKRIEYLIERHIHMFIEDSLQQSRKVPEKGVETFMNSIYVNIKGLKLNFVKCI
jgi:hypothetical protein